MHFKVQTLTEEMSRSDLVPSFNEKLFTWFPQKLQALTKKPTKIDYIFTTEDILEISETDRISADLLGSDHCLLKIQGKQAKITTKIKRFPDE